MLSTFGCFFFKDPATTEIYPLSLHDALPISLIRSWRRTSAGGGSAARRSSSPTRNVMPAIGSSGDRKSTRLNSSHVEISYAVFCLKKKNSPCVIVVTLILKSFEGGNEYCTPL